MRGLLFGFAALLVSTTANAEITSNNTDAKPVDHSKYCYYSDIEYSAGSIMEQAGRKMQCVRKEESTDLVWKEYYRKQL